MTATQNHIGPVSSLEEWLITFSDYIKYNCSQGVLIMDF